MKRIKFANTFIDSFSLSDVVKTVEINIKLKKKTHIVFLNSLKVSEISKNEKIKKAMHEAEMILADGVPIVWFSRFFGEKLPGRVNGTDLFERLIEWAAINKKKIFLLGAKEENLNKLIKKLNNKYPTLEVKGRNGYFDEEEDEEIIKEINNSNADILFLGFSSPKKEIWANKYKDKISIPIIQGVGGSFDVLSGIIPRAPKWMQKSGLEWFYRVIKEPRRMFKRYLYSNTMFLIIVIKCLIFNQDDSH